MIYLIIALWFIGSILLAYDLGRNKSYGHTTSIILDLLAEENFVKYHYDENGEMVLEPIEEPEESDEV
tara:strand:- start:26406 stop:26609 length:204 start_codon:yes stop_codon:yes gene_type:complete